MGNVLTEIWKKKEKKERKKERNEGYFRTTTHALPSWHLLFLYSPDDEQTAHKWTRFWFCQMINRDHIQVFQVTVQVYSPCFFTVALPPKNFLRGWSVCPHKVILDFSTLSYYSTIHKKCLTWCTNDSFWFNSLLSLTDRPSYSPSWLKYSFLKHYWNN